jgi:glucose-1-phosphate adenylyltransferase
MTSLTKEINRRSTARSIPLHPAPLDMNRVAAIILGGGQGTRLFPLTQTRCKPALSFGGRYHLIDVPISNAFNSGCKQIFILTQFLSSSLNHHIYQSYPTGVFFTGFIKLLPAEEKYSQKEWFQGTADAVRQNLHQFIETPVDYFLILSGDQLYHMDFRPMLQFAQETNADLVISTTMTSKEEAKRMGVLKIDGRHFITDFCEKPQEEALLRKMISHPRMFKNSPTPFDEEKPYLASMGIYLFKREALFHLLEHDMREDFGKHLIPTQVAKGNSAAYMHHGYWVDIGTIESFYAANMNLLKPNPEFDLYDENHHIFANRSFLPGPKIIDTQISQSIISEGSFIEAAQIHNSILGPRLTIKKGTIIKDSYLIGNDFSQPRIRAHTLPDELYIGENCIIQKAIVDKHVKIGNGVKLINKNNLQHYNGEDVYIRDGIIVVPKGVTLPNDFIL